MMRPLILLFVIILAVMFQGGCATPVTKSEITPTTVTLYRSTGMSIAVLPVIVKEQPKAGFTDTIHSMPSSQAYRDGIISALTDSGVFSRVVTEGAADYSLSTEVIGERLLGGMNNIALILIRYRLVNEHDGSTIWRKNLFSYSMLSAQKEFMGAERAKRVIGDAVKDNVTQVTTLVGNTLSSTQ